MNALAENAGCTSRESSLFKSIYRLMHTEQLYKDNGLTLENLAERLSTNRTYVSNAFNHCAGMSFPTYVNKLRIDEAVRILSDCGNDIAMTLPVRWDSTQSARSTARFRPSLACLPHVSV